VIPDLFTRAVITVSFHPDRLLADGVCVADHLVEDGAYHNQFRTGISNGGLGGDRRLREDQMFPGRTDDDRPVYGALNLAGHPDGASPRFGSCHLVLDPAVSERATFSLGDSLARPTITATASAFEPVWQGLVPPLARAVAERCGVARLDAEVIGRAARSVVRDPGDWSSFGTPAEVLQLIKYLWHILVLRGDCAPGRRNP
jgi:hypothetical protein